MLAPSCEKQHGLTMCNNIISSNPTSGPMDDGSDVLTAISAPVRTSHILKHPSMDVETILSPEKKTVMTLTNSHMLVIPNGGG